MADKGNTWLNGTGVISPRGGVQPHPIGPTSGPRSGSTARTVLVVAALAVFTMAVLTVVPEAWAWELLRVMAVGLVLLSLFYLPVRYRQPAFVVWAMLLFSECLFFREGDSSANVKAYQGDFPTAVYGEVLMWGLCFLTVLGFSSRIKGFFSRAFEGDIKWPALFALLCMASCSYTPRPTLGLVWAFKLGLIVLLLLLCSIQMRDFRDTISFLRFTILGYLVVVMQPVVVAILRGELFDEDGRMSTVVSPNALSPNAAVIVLLALTLYSKRKGEGLHKSAIVLGISACVVMLLAASKTGIMAAVIAGLLYFVVCRKFGSAMTFVAATLVLAGILVLTTPLGGYLHAYRQGEGAESLSGRTILWTAVKPAIEAKPILGHGYMASEFIALQVRDVGWAAPQLHNGFLETAYNTGAVGLLIMLIVIGIIPLNLYRVLRRLPPTDPIYRVSAGCLSLFVFLLINAFFNSNFGGKPNVPFMMLFALLVVSSKLGVLSDGSSAGVENAGFAARIGPA